VTNALFAKLAAKLAAELAAELAEVYRDADAAFAGWTCSSSTECCRFGITGREPYVTSIELAAVRRAVAALGGPKAWKRARRSLPMALPHASHASPASPASANNERPCPLLTEAGRCAIYASRPLGCRTFYCDRAAPAAPVRHRAITALVRRVQTISARHEQGGDQGRPLTRALIELADPAASRRR
jgi:Fe-S-cluster containining protein